jgi:dihydrofolate reductase / thymidylate synthase
MRTVDVILASTARGGIGLKNALPWHLPADMAYFKSLTTHTETVGLKNAVIMGRKTWSSIPSKFRPLPGRVNIVLSRSADVRSAESIPEDVLVSPSLEAAVTLLSNPPHGPQVENIFVIGGATAFEEAIGGKGPVACRTIYLTRVHAELECDVFVTPVDDARFALVDFKVFLQGIL